MKKTILLYLTLCMAMLMASCGKDLKDSDDLGVEIEYEAIKSEIDVSETSFSIDASEQTLKIQINCNSYWTAETKSDWFYLGTTNGKGNGTLSVRVYSNPSITATRTDGVTVTDGFKTISIVVTQAPSPEQLSLSEDYLSFTYGGGNSYIYVESNCEWTATSDADWCRVSNYSSSFYVSAERNNSYTQRTATITVRGSSASNTVKVSQAAAKEPVVEDLTVSNITKTSADCQFTYSSSDLYIQRRGVCYSTTNKTPTTDDDCKYSSSSSYSGTPTFSLTNLNQNTTYYVRPYVITSVGTTYGKTVKFTTSKSNSPNEGDNPLPNY